MIFHYYDKNLLQVYLLKSIPLRLCAISLAFNGLPLSTCIDWTNVSINTLIFKKPECVKLRCLKGVSALLVLSNLLITWFHIQIGRLHCLLPWWEDATVNFMISGGYNVIDQIKHVCGNLLLNNLNGFLSTFITFFYHHYVNKQHFLAVKDLEK